MDYNSAKKSFTEIKEDMISHPFKTAGILLLIILVFVSCVALTTLINNYVSKHTDSSLIPLSSAYKPPQFKFTYTRQLETKSIETGYYSTIFEISTERPSGNFEKEPIIINNIKNAECTKPEWIKSEAMENNGRQIFEIQTYQVKCISKKPILDTKNLFNFGE